MAGVTQSTDPLPSTSLVPDATPMDDDNSSCVPGYFPTVSEYREALGGYHTALVVIGTLLSAALYCLFFEQIMYTLRNVNKVYRRHVLWITSVCPFMTLMTLMCVVIPRADKICNSFKAMYMSVGISHFMDLTTLMFGSEKVMLAQLNEEKLTLNLGPCCCCFVCLPRPPVSAAQLRWVRWLIWQLPFTQAIYFTIGILCSTGDSQEDGRVDPNPNYLWLLVINISSFLMGVYALNIMSLLCEGQLKKYNYQRKASCLKALPIVTQLQRGIFDFILSFNVFPCISAFISPTVYKITVENALYFLEMMILGPLTYWQFHNTALVEENPREAGEKVKDELKEVGIGKWKGSQEETQEETQTEEV